MSEAAGLVVEKKRSSMKTRPVLQRAHTGNGCRSCTHDPDFEEGEIRLQRKENGSFPSTQGVPPIVHDVLRSQGLPLDANTRAFFEPRFGNDFSQVRIHKDAEAIASAQQVHARAYTVGNEIVFGGGQYLPETAEGKKLLAHELTHVVQQATSAHEMPVEISPARGDSESEAEYVSSQVMNTGESSPVSNRPGPISRSPVALSREPLFDMDCHLPDRCQLKASLGAAHQMLDNAITELRPLASGKVKKGRVVDLLNVHFHDPSNVKGRAKFVMKNYEQIKTELDSPYFKCHPPEEKCPTTKKGSVIAFTETWSGSSISLCPTFYLWSCAQEGRALIHEAFHHIAKMPSDDFAYVAAKDDYESLTPEEKKSLTVAQYIQLKKGEYISLTAEQAAENPDTYSQFALKVFPGTPGCNICNRAELTRLSDIFGL